MGKKKPFIDKKNASVYHLVRRSQRDVGGFYDEETGEALDVPRDFVLMPTPETQVKIDEKKKLVHAQAQAAAAQGQAQEGLGELSADDALSRARAQLKAADLVDDYDYSRHMMPISGTGVFFGKEGNRYDPSLDSRSKNIPLEPVIKEVDRQLDSIAINPDYMDEDIANALFDYDENDFEEILDDFCLTAAQEPEEEDVSEVFDFDAHINRLIEKARMEENGGRKVAPKNHEAWSKSNQEFSGIKPFRKHENDAEDEIDYRYDENDDVMATGRDLDEFDYADLEEEVLDANPGVVAKLNAEEEKALCDKFEQTLLEYDSDDMGDLDDECFDIRGDKPLEGDVQIEAALDQFLRDKKDQNLLAGTRHLEKRTGGSSKVFVNNSLVPFNAIDAQEAEDEKEEDRENIDDVLAEADRFLANPEVELPPEEVLIDGKSYFTMKERNPWDCESILSTYSNLDNNPAVVGRSRRRKKKGKKKNAGGIDLDDEATIPEEQPVQIMLSNKTGLPLGVLPERHQGGGDLMFEEEETFMSVNKGEARNKKETKEEKRLRKKAIKEERQIARIQKKMMKEAIEEEFCKRSGPVLGNDVAGKSVFRYS